MKKLILLIALTVIALKSNAVNLSWQINYWGFTSSKAIDMKQNSNGTYVLARLEYSGATPQSGDSDRLVILRYNATGSLLNTYQYITLPTTKQDPHALLLDNAGNVFVLFTYTSYNAAFSEYYVLKMNSTLTTQLGLYSPNYGTTPRKGILMRFADNNSSIVIATYTYPTSPAANKTEFTKIDLNGNKLWNYSYNAGTGTAHINDFKIKSGRVICCGYRILSGSTAQYIWIMAINLSNGVYKFEYTNVSNVGVWNAASEVEGDNSKNVYACGSLYNSNAGTALWNMVKLDSVGTVKWNKTYDPGFFNNHSDTVLRNMAIDSKGNLYYLGMVEGYNDKTRLLKLNSAGTQKWAKIINNNVSLLEVDPIDLSISTSDKIYFATHNVYYYNTQNCNTHLYQYDTLGNKLDEDTCFFNAKGLRLAGNNVLAYGYFSLSTLPFPGYAVFNATPIRMMNETTEATPLSEKTISIFPNPASTEINLKPNFDLQQFEMKIYDANGRLVKKLTSDSQNSIPVNDLNDGFYFVSIKSGEYEYKQKFLVKH